MAEVTLASASVKQKWLGKYFKEAVRSSGFLPYMKNGDNSVIVPKKDLLNEAGQTINIPLITKLRSNGVGGSAVLKGNESALANYNCPVSVDWIRNGVKVPKSESYKTDIDLFEAGKSNLTDWSAEDLRTDIIYALMQPVSTGSTTVPYAEITEDTTNGGYQIASGYVAGSTFNRRTGVEWTAATEAEKDAWLLANSDRILFGASKNNSSSNDHSTSLATVDTTSDKLTVATAQLAKRMARAATPRINPFRTDGGREYFIMFCGPRSFRDLKADSTMQQANRDARAREGGGMDENPLFQDGDLIYDGIIFREIPEIPHIVGVGNSSCDVEPNFLCGQQALAVAWGQMPNLVVDMTDDYKFRPGVASEELRGVKKLAFNGKQNGVVTLYTAATAD